LKSESLSAGAFQKPAGQRREEDYEKVICRPHLFESGICLAANHAVLVTAQSNTSRLPPKEAEQTIARRARRVLLYLKSRNVRGLSALFHREKVYVFHPTTP